MPPPFRYPHWNRFASIPLVTQGPVGTAPDLWARKLGLTGVPNASGLPPGTSGLPSGKLTRQQVRTYCTSPTTPVLFGYVCAMAWGGQTKKNALTAWQSRTQLVPILTQLRGGGLTALQAFHLFTTGKDWKFDGLGPSYFTKLIHFFSPQPDLYIVDNFVLASLEVLTGLPHRARATPGGYVAACWEMDQMKGQPPLSCTGADIEARLFSKKGEPWRVHANAQTMSKPGRAGYRAQMAAVYSAGGPRVAPQEFW